VGAGAAVGALVAVELIASVAVTAGVLVAVGVARSSGEGVGAWGLATTSATGDRDGGAVGSRLGAAGGALPQPVSASAATSSAGSITPDRLERAVLDGVTFPTGRRGLTAWPSETAENAVVTSQSLRGAKGMTDG